MIIKSKTKQELADMLTSAKNSAIICGGGVEDLKDELDSLRVRIADAKREIKHCEAQIVENEARLENTIGLEQEFLKDIKMYDKALTQLNNEKIFSKNRV